MSGPAGSVTGYIMFGKQCRSRSTDLKEASLSSVEFYKKIFKVFPFGCHGNQNSAWNGMEIFEQL